MRDRIGLAMLVLLCGFSPPRTAAAQGAVVADSLLKELVALERAALDRWITLDPVGYLDLYAPEITYFDVTTEKRVDGREAMEQRLAPLKNVKLPFIDPRYEMIDPRVQRHGDAADPIDRRPRWLDGTRPRSTPGLTDDGGSSTAIGRT